jgi:hypothetical protein
MLAMVKDNLDRVKSSRPNNKTLLKRKMAYDAAAPLRKLVKEGRQR